MATRLLNTQRIVNLSSDPASGTAGEIYYNTVANALKFYNGSTWGEFGGGSGTVTSVGVSVPTGLSVANSPVTTSGTIAISLASGYTIPTTAALDAKAPLASPTFTGTVTLPTVSASGVFTTSNYINRTTANGNSSWLQQDGTGRVHWYWNTLGGTSPTFTNAGEDASAITQHITLNGNGGSVFFRSANGVGASAGGPITWTTTLYVDLNTITFKGTPLALTSGATFTGTVIAPAATTTLAPLRLPHGTAPSSPTNGDIWTTTTGLFARINGITEQYAKLASPAFTGTVSASTIDASNGILVEAYTKDDITTRTDGGFFQTATATTAEGWPETTNSWYHLISSTHSNTSNYYSLQLAAPFYSNALYFRSTNGVGTTSWTKVGTAATYYQISAPSSPATGDIWVDSDETYVAINSNDYVLKSEIDNYVFNSFFLSGLIS